MLGIGWGMMNSSLKREEEEEEKEEKEEEADDDEEEWWREISMTSAATKLPSERYILNQTLVRIDRKTCRPSTCYYSELF